MLVLIKHKDKEVKQIETAIKVALDIRYESRTTWTRTGTTSEQSTSRILIGGAVLGTEPIERYSDTVRIPRLRTHGPNEWYPLLHIDFGGTAFNCYRMSNWGQIAIRKAFQILYYGSISSAICKSYETKTRRLDIASLEPDPLVLAYENNPKAFVQLIPDEFDNIRVRFYPEDAPENFIEPLYFAPDGRLRRVKQTQETLDNFPLSFHTTRCSDGTRAIRV
jgi:hypothetical protein